MAEMSGGNTLPSATVTESDIWERVNAFKESGALAIKGMAGTDTDWLHELAKHQEWLRYANSMWPELPNCPGTMDGKELAVLEEMRLAHPSEEDAIWAAGG